MVINKLAKLTRYLLLLLVFGILAVCLCYAWISWRSNGVIYNHIKQVPPRHIGLVLGTNKYLRKGKINEYYQARIDTAAKLYHAGKVSYLIVSGDNRKNNYNEPKQMRADLIAAGVPAERIQPDYAGLRTLDSILRIDKVFGHKDYIIISQRFHNQRAIFLAKAKGHTPIAFDAPNPQKQGMKKVISREFLARVRAVMDLLTNKKARHYGDPIPFPPAQTTPTSTPTSTQTAHKATP